MHYIDIYYIKGMDKYFISINATVKAIFNELAEVAIKLLLDNGDSYPINKNTRVLMCGTSEDHPDGFEEDILVISDIADNGGFKSEPVNRRSQEYYDFYLLTNPRFVEIITSSELANDSARELVRNMVYNEYTVYKF